MFFYSQPEPGYLKISGPHQIEFLQRQTTNDVRSLIPNRAILAVLTTPTARILDVFYLFLDQAPEISEPAIGVLCLPGHADATAAYLKSRIFFMDRVVVHNVSQEFLQVDLFGPQIETVLQRLGISEPPQPGHFLWTQTVNTKLFILGHIQGGGLGFRLLCPSKDAEAFSAVLADSGARRLDHETYEVYRIEAGLPAAGSELSVEFTPLEVNLGAAISDHKGCYTGQEVIARQITYEKVTRRMVGLRLEAGVARGSSLYVDGKPVGVVTSAVESSTHGPIALAVIRRPFYEPGAKLIAHTERGEIGATVSALPFG